MERLFFLQHAQRRVPGLKSSRGSSVMTFSGQVAFAQSALYAQAFGEAQHGAVRIIRQRAGRAGGDAGMAERAAFDFEVHAAKRRRLTPAARIDGAAPRGGVRERCLKHAALGAAGHEGGGPFRDDAFRRCIEHGAQLVGIIGLDDAPRPAPKGERCTIVPDVSAAWRSPEMSVWVWRASAWRRRCRHRRTRGDVLRSELCDLVDTQRQHMGRQSGAEPCQCIDQGVAMLAVVKQTRWRCRRRPCGRFAAACAIAASARPRWERIGRSARRARRCARAAARAHIGVDRHGVPVRRDCAGRTQVETARAAGNAGTGMGAQRVFELNEARLVERADQAARTAIARSTRRGRGIGAQISGRNSGAGIAACHLEIEIRSQVEVAPSRAGPNSSFARDEARQRIVVDRKFECAEMAARVADGALRTGNSLIRRGTRRRVLSAAR